MFPTLFKLLIILIKEITSAWQINGQQKNEDAVLTRENVTNQYAGICSILEAIGKV